MGAAKLCADDYTFRREFLTCVAETRTFLTLKTREIRVLQLRLAFRKSPYLEMREMKRILKGTADACPEDRRPAACFSGHNNAQLKPAPQCPETFAKCVTPDGNNTFTLSFQPLRHLEH